jgi:hypothetical protein
MITRVLYAVMSVAAFVCIAAADTLPGFNDIAPFDPPMRQEHLFKGDLVPEMGIGCSNATGNSGGPNDVAQGITATQTLPVVLCSHWYYIYTQVSINITSLSFVCWRGGTVPGDEFARQAGFGLVGR